MRYISPGHLKQMFMLSTILVICGLVVWQIIPYLSGVLGALTLYVLMDNWMVTLVKRGWNRTIAALFLIVLSFVSIFLPLIIIILMLGGRIGKLADRSEGVMEALKERMFVLEKYVDYDVSNKIDPPEYSIYVAEFLQGLLGSTATTLISIALMYFLLFYMFIDQGTMKDRLTSFVPIGRDNLKKILTAARSKVRANAIGIPLVAFAQGIVALVGFIIFQVEDPLFWSAIVAIGSMVPFIGTALGILPVFILLLGAGNDYQAWTVLIYGFIVVGSTDNLIRLYALKRLDNIHPLVTLIGVLVGIPLFGFIGLIFGPLLISILFVVLRIYRMRYVDRINATENEKL
ncbi:AI-2E family transporter [Zobellia laminariae]|uniref:AI-2E family transporter n=1 Tax=Zobellia laminariae TaxID=248906 RepID=UPI0012D8C19F|nr:AI-2E family transporter [Zobellia laminariae]